MTENLYLCFKFFRYGLLIAFIAYITTMYVCKSFVIWLLSIVDLVFEKIFQSDDILNTDKNNFWRNIQHNIDMTKIKIFANRIKSPYI